MCDIIKSFEWYRIDQTSNIGFSAKVTCGFLTKETNETVLKKIVHFEALNHIPHYWADKELKSVNVNQTYSSIIEQIKNWRVLMWIKHIPHYWADKELKSVNVNQSYSSLLSR